MHDAFIMLRFILFLTASIFAFTSGVSAQSPVWKVTQGEHSLYLGGTCHMLRSSDFPLPEEFDHAYASADRLIFEVDPRRMEDPQVGMQLMMQSRYTDGRTLKDVLSPEAYNALAKQGEKSGLPIAILEGLKPGMAVMMISLQELIKIGATEEGVDMIYAKRAKKDGKPIGSLETVEFQIEMVTSLGEGLESDFVLYSLQDLEQIEKFFDDLIRSWRTGDSAAITKLFVEDMQEFPDIYAKLIVDRNQNWLKQIKPLLNTPDTELILVGAGHLVGPDGLIEKLTTAGCTVENLAL